MIDPLSWAQYSIGANFRIQALELRMTDNLLLALETKLDQLVQLCDSLQRDNQKLRAKESSWLQERARLIEKNELARTRVEAMITRLKSLEQEG